MQADAKPHKETAKGHDDLERWQTISLRQVGGSKKQESHHIGNEVATCGAA